MINNKRILAVIPARGGSKRLPRKNVLPLAGKPLINWSIEAGKKSQYI
ncbi:acylneuraminate cytidylyltransferase family protein, partial [Vibrio splendidus]